MSKNLYRQGWRAELALMKRLRQSPDFHTVLRSAGSRSPFDVVAIGPSRILLCQVKTGKGTFKREREELKQIPVPRCARKQMCIYRRGAWTMHQVP